MPIWEITDEIELGEVVTAVRAAILASDRAQVVALHGDLGAGKTTFTQQLARTLGVKEQITSPTFVIMKQYETTVDDIDLLVHIDAYRLETAAELAVLGFADLLTLPKALIVIEWAENVADLLPADTLHVSFSIVEQKRRIELTHDQTI